MRAAWLGAGFTMLGVVLTLVAQPIVNDWLGPKREGVFSVEQTCLSAKNLDPSIAPQVASFPCQLRVAHIDGPAVTKLSVSLTSANRLSGVRTERNDENVVPVLSTGDQFLSVDVPTLRQGSVIDVRFMSNGEPHIDKTVVRESGRMLSEARAETERSWLDTWYGVAGLVLVFAVTGGLVAYLLYSSVLRPAIGPLPRSMLVGGLAIGMLSLIPIFDIGEIVQTVLLLAIFHVVSKRQPGA